MDKGSLIGESRETPMLVGGVHLFTLPDGVHEREYLYSLAQNLHTTDAHLAIGFGGWEGAGEPVEDVSKTSRWVRRAEFE